MANKWNGFELSWVTWFTNQWNDVTSRLKKYIKEEDKNEEQCIQSKCEHSEVD